MTPAALRRKLHLLHPIDWPTEPAALLAAVEVEADRRAGDPVWTALSRAAAWLATAPTALPEGLHRDTLVRADLCSATWTAHDPDGATFLVRVPREDAGPVDRRILDRDAQVLGDLVGCVRVEQALVAPLPGVPLADAPPPSEQSASALGSTLLQLQRWAIHGLSPHPPAIEELRWSEGAVVVVSLTPGIGTHEHWMRAVVQQLRDPDESPIGQLVERLRSLAVPALSDVVHALQAALAATLSQEAVDLHRRGLLRGHSDRRERLVKAVGALHKAARPPIGRAAVGYDLDGRETFVVSDGITVRWGHDAEAAILYDRGVFKAPIARRLLRACVAAPTGGAPFTEAIGRWVGAGLRLRTVHMLLEKTG